MTTATASPPSAAAAIPQAAAAAMTPVSMFSDASEKIVLANAFREDRGPLINRLMALLAAEDFYLEQHRSLWSSMRALADSGKPHDVAAVLDYCNARQVFVGGVEYLAQLHDDPLAATASEQAVDAAAKRIKEWSTKRRFMEVCRQGMALCASASEPDEIMGAVEDDLRNLRMLSKSASTGPQHISTAVLKVLDSVQRQMDGEPILACSTGFDELDALIYGLVPGDLIVLAARPSMGKTALALNVGVNVGRRVATDKNAFNVLIFSTEMGSEALARRALATAGRLALTDLRRGELDGDDFSRLSEAMEVLQHAGIYIDDTPGISLHELRARARAHVAKHGKCVIIVDYLQNLGNTDGLETKDHVSKISNGLKMLARELGCPVVALSQLSRGLEQRANKRPLMSDLRESGTIEQDADVVMFIYRDEYYNPDTKEPGIAEVIVAKQRDGAVGTVKLAFEKLTQQFVSVRGY